MFTQKEKKNLFSIAVFKFIFQLFSYILLIHFLVMKVNVYKNSRVIFVFDFKQKKKK